jgi:hypothetical protein
MKTKRISLAITMEKSLGMPTLPLKSGASALRRKPDMDWGFSPRSTLLILGGAAVHRCDNRIALGPALAAEGPWRFLRLSENLGKHSPCQP